MFDVDAIKKFATKHGESAVVTFFDDCACITGNRGIFILACNAEERGSYPASTWCRSIDDPIAKDFSVGAGRVGEATASAPLSVVRRAIADCAGVINKPRDFEPLALDNCLAFGHGAYSATDGYVMALAEDDRVQGAETLAVCRDLADVVAMLPKSLKEDEITVSFSARGCHAPGHFIIIYARVPSCRSVSVDRFDGVFPKRPAYKLELSRGALEGVLKEFMREKMYPRKKTSDKTHFAAIVANGSTFRMKLLHSDAADMTPSVAIEQKFDGRASGCIILDARLLLNTLRFYSKKDVIRVSVPGSDDRPVAFEHGRKRAVLMPLDVAPRYKKVLSDD